MATPARTAVTVESPVAPPFHLSYALAYFRRFPAAFVERTDEGSYTRALDADTAMRVEAAGSDDAPALRIRVWRGDGEAPPAADVAAAVATARRAFAADDPLPPPPGDPVLAELAARWPGLRPARFPDPFECLCWAILGQQITVVFAARLKRTLLERYGRSGPNGLPLFPRPHDLAAADAQELAAAQFSRQKIRYLLAVAADPPDWGAIARLPAEEAVAALTALPGVGRWTAEYVLIRSLGFCDVVPAADAGLKRAVGAAYGLGRRATEAEVRDRAANWPGFAAYAAFHWWYALQQGLYR
jgi:3-methyladenine DNA glycosylase/8-oxoguanine DNA glycosylase